MLPLKDSFTNVVFFARRIPLVLRRRRLGDRYLRTHPLIPTHFEPPRPKEIVEQLSITVPSVNVESFSIDKQSFKQWREEARYPLLAYHLASEEKYLEHFVSFELLRPIVSGVLIDVASCRSYFPNIMRRRGFRVIQQDLEYEHGLHADRLGGDAAVMALSPGFADALTLHCSYEHFEGDTDIRFLKEAARVLRIGGRAVIVPLYIHHRYLTLADPSELAESTVHIDPGAALVAMRGYGNRHGRFYDPAAFSQRVYATAVEAGLRVRLFQIKNASEISRHCYMQFAMTLDKLP